MKTLKLIYQMCIALSINFEGVRARLKSEGYDSAYIEAVIRHLRAYLVGMKTNHDIMPSKNVYDAVVLTGALDCKVLEKHFYQEYLELPRRYVRCSRTDKDNFEAIVINTASFLQYYNLKIKTRIAVVNPQHPERNKISFGDDILLQM